MARKPATITKADAITVRLHPRTRFGIELAARRERRTISAIVERLIEEGLKNDGEFFGETTDDILEKVWHPDECERLINLATEYRNLLDYKEERIWKAIETCSVFWSGGKAKQLWSGRKSTLHMDEIRKHWKLLNAIGNEEKGFEALPKG